MPEETPSKWNEWSHHVLLGIERIEADLEKLEERVTQLHVDLARLQTEFKIKAGIWGLLGGALVAIAALLMKK